MSLTSQVKHVATPRPTHGRDAADAAQPATTISIRASVLGATKAPERRFVLDGLIPDRNVTLFSGDGGLGKSLVALHIAMIMASGSKWLGRGTAAGEVVLLSAEDELHEIHRRLEQICEHEETSLSSLTGLHIVPLAGKDALLAIPDRERGAMRPTTLLGHVRTALDVIRPKLLIVDTLADTFGGNEIDRAQARSFIGMLRGLALELDMGVLLVAHPSLAGMASGSGSSGSTGWSNSVRSRLYLERPAVEKDEEPDEDARILSVKKSNYSAAGLTIPLRWQDGVFVRDDGEADLEREVAIEAKASAAEVVFLEILTQMTEQGRTVSPAPSASYAPALFEKHPLAKGFRKKAFVSVMERLLHAGGVHVEVTGPPSKKRQQLVIGPSPPTIATAE